MDLEEELQKKMAQKRGLVKVRRVTHPEESLGESRYQVEKFVKMGKQDKEKQAAIRETWERELWQETGYCSTGGSPEHLVKGGRPIVHEAKIYRKPEAVPIGESEIDRLRKENAELRHMVAQLLKQNDDLNKKLDLLLKK